MKKHFLIILVICLISIISVSVFAARVGYASYVGSLDPNATISGQNYTYCYSTTYDYYDNNSYIERDGTGAPASHQIKGLIYNSLGSLVNSSSYVYTSDGSFQSIVANFGATGGYRSTSQVKNYLGYAINTGGLYERWN